MLRQIAAVTADEPQERSATARRLDRRRRRHHGRRRRARLRVHDGRQPDGLVDRGGQRRSGDRPAQRRQRPKAPACCRSTRPRIVASAPGDRAHAGRPQRRHGRRRHVRESAAAQERHVARARGARRQRRELRRAPRDRARRGSAVQPGFARSDRRPQRANGVRRPRARRDGQVARQRLDDRRRVHDRRRDGGGAHHRRRHAGVGLRARLRQQRHGASSRSPAAFDELKAALDANPTLSVDVYREPDYFAQGAASSSTTCSSSSPTSSARSWRPARSSAR